MSKKLTYISLFSGAGVGCYGFQMEGFDCIATNEFIPRRLEIQKYNKKCKYDAGYVLGDITTDEVKQKLYNEIEYWRKHEQLKDVDVIVATPPCQGMSVANHKKTANEIVRNSLVVESVSIVHYVKPKIFIFENVPAFMKTLCTDIDGKEKPIGQMLSDNLTKHYSIYANTINFKNYGACSSRTRSLVVAVRRDLADNFAPIEVYPTYKKETSLREVIGSLKRLKEYAEIDPDDIYHAFRPYPEHMRAWISELKEGQSAFDNADKSRIPHRVEDGAVIYNTNKNGDKYRRQIWDKTGPCIHTRNDQLASQNTVHPEDDRVFSIRELMRMMTIPDTFNWVEIAFSDLNELSYPHKKAFLKKEETKIRQTLGEAVPTEIFRSVAKHIRYFLELRYLNSNEIKSEVKNNALHKTDNLINYIDANPLNIGFSSLCRVAEAANSNRAKNAAYFTNKALISEIINELPNIDKNSIHILEPSVGAGSFIPLIVRRYEHIKNIFIDAVDIDSDSLKVLQSLMCRITFAQNVEINYINADFLMLELKKQYDIVIGNPPFEKLSGTNKSLRLYKAQVFNNQTNNTASFFLEKALRAGNFCAMVMPKFILNTPEFALSREMLRKKKMSAILDFGEKGFTGVLVETVALCVDTKDRPSSTSVFSLTNGFRIVQKQTYICAPELPYWVIYRDRLFDYVYSKMHFGVFDVFRDRQITNSITNSNTGIRVIKARNISNDGSCILDIQGYDSYISAENAQKLSVYKFLNRSDVYLTPNMTYYPRVIKKPDGVLVNGSAAILKLKADQKPLSREELDYFASDEYRAFYRTARNQQTRSLNIDANSVYFFGRLGG